MTNSLAITHLNNYFAQAKQPLFAYLSLQDLAMLRASCKAFKEIIDSHPKSIAALIQQHKLHEIKLWARRTSIPAPNLYQLLTMAQSKCHGSTSSPKELKPFSMETLLTIAKMLRFKGDEEIPAYGLGIKMPVPLSASMYIYGLAEEDRTRIYYHLLKVKGIAKAHWTSSMGGEAFFKSGSSTNVEKAEACEQFVLESLAKRKKFCCSCPQWCLVL